MGLFKTNFFDWLILKTNRIKVQISITLKKQKLFSYLLLALYYHIGKSNKNNVSNKMNYKPSLIS